MEVDDIAEAAERIGRQGYLLQRNRQFVFVIGQTRGTGSHRRPPPMCTAPRRIRGQVRRSIRAAESGYRGCAPHRERPGAEDHLPARTRTMLLAAHRSGPVRTRNPGNQDHSTRTGHGRVPRARLSAYATKSMTLPRPAVTWRVRTHKVGAPSCGQWRRFRVAR